MWNRRNAANNNSNPINKWAITDAQSILPIPRSMKVHSKGSIFSNLLNAEKMKTAANNATNADPIPRNM
jgi:hypothetical protein